MGTERILLVEDHRSLSDNLAYLLNREPGLEVVGQVVSAAECRRFASSGKGFDVVILDLLLPGLTVVSGKAAGPRKNQTKGIYHDR